VRFQVFPARRGAQIFAELTMLVGVRCRGPLHRPAPAAIASSPPINWYADTHSKIDPVRDTGRMVRDLLRIRLTPWPASYGPFALPSSRSPRSPRRSRLPA